MLFRFWKVLKEMFAWLWYLHSIHRCHWEVLAVKAEQLPYDQVEDNCHAVVTMTVLVGQRVRVFRGYLMPKSNLEVYMWTEEYREETQVKYYKPVSSAENHYLDYLYRTFGFLSLASTIATRTLYKINDRSFEIPVKLYNSQLAVTRFAACCDVSLDEGYQIDWEHEGEVKSHAIITAL